MPAFLTHWYVLIETARRSQDAGSDLGSLIVDARTLQRRAPLPAPPQTPPAGAVWDTGPLPEIDFRFPGSDISAMAYLGALAPNFGFFQKGLFREKIIKGVSPRQASDQSPATTHWAALLHTNRTGDVLRTLLEHIAEIPSPALRSQALAFAMGYTSHLATDMALNPCINALAGAYRDRRQSLAIHSYIELCLDEYVAERYFHHTLHSWTGQPWGQYIEPSASHMLQPGTLSGQVFDLLMAAAETTYGLSEVQCQSFQQTQRMGLRRLRYYLAGRGIFRALTLYALTRSRQNDPIAACIAAHSAENGTTTF